MAAAVCIDQTTYLADLKAALAERDRLPKLPPVVVVPTRETADAVRIDLAEAGWTDPDIRVSPEIVSVYRKHLAKKAKP